MQPHLLQKNALKNIVQYGLVVPICLITLVVSCTSQFSSPSVVAQNSTSPKSEADRLFQQFFEQMQAGKWDNAVKLGQQALIIYRQNKNRSREADILGNMGIAYRAKNNYTQSLVYLEQTLKVMQEIKSRQGEWTALQQLALTYRALGNSEQAREYLERQLKLSELEGKPGWKAAALANLGLVQFDLGDYDQALKSMQEQLNIARKISDSRSEETALSNLGLVYETIGNLPKAIAYYEQVLQRKKERNDLTGIAYTQGNLGLVYRAQRNYKKAIPALQQYLDAARSNNDGRGEWVALNNLGVALYESRQVNESIATLLKAIKVQESLRVGLNDTNKVSIFEMQAMTYGTLQLAYIEQNKIADALEIAERGRARAFIDLLAARIEENPQAKIPPPTIAEIKQIAKEQNATLVTYSVIHQTDEIFIWVIAPTGEITFQRLGIKNKELEDLVIKNIRSIITQSHSLERGGNNIGFSISPGDKVKFKDDRPNSQSWDVLKVNSEAQTIKVRLPDFTSGTSFDRPIKDVVAKVSTNNSVNATANVKYEGLQKLHKLLIRPIANLLPSDPNAKIIFIPHRQLFSVPFPALQDDKGRYLIEKHTILTAPSIQALQLTRQQRGRITGNGKNVVVVGNPTMPKVVKIAGEQPEQLASLPAAEIEAKAIANLFNTKPLIGHDATKAAILPLLPKARIIHFATHGLLDDKRGLGSAVALAPTNQDNGLLTAEEILKLKLNADLVVLSACNTGQGRITGDGVIGLSRSLISAGIPSAIVSLWSVPDAPTADLMTEFYQQWQQNPDKARALRLAMLKTIQHNPEPKDWAAFTLIGEAN